MRLARETDAAADRAVAKEPDPFEAEYDMLVHDVKVGVAPRGPLGQAFARHLLGGKSVIKAGSVLGPPEHGGACTGRRW